MDITETLIKIQHISISRSFKVFYVYLHITFFTDVIKVKSVNVKTKCSQEAI